MSPILGADPAWYARLALIWRQLACPTWQNTKGSQILRRRNATVHVVIIGAGLIGLSIAYALTRRNASVTVLERRKTVAAGTSGASFAWVNASAKTDNKAYFLLNWAGLQAHERLAEELGNDAWLHRVGNMEWVSPDSLPVLSARVDYASAMGYDAQLVPAATLNAELNLPLPLDPDYPVAWFPREAWVDVPLLAQILTTTIVQHRGTIRTASQVNAITQQGSRVTGVTLTDDQWLTADAVVNAAGPDAHRIAQMVGRQLPLRPEPGLLLSLAVDSMELPCIIHTPEINLRPAGEGHLLLHHQSVDRTLGDELDLAPDAPPCRELRERAQRLFPALVAATSPRAAIGIRPIPADGYPCVGQVPELDGYFEAITHSGITLGPVLGDLLAEEILSRRVDPLLAPFRPNRF